MKGVGAWLLAVDEEMNGRNREQGVILSSEGNEGSGSSRLLAGAWGGVRA